MNPVFQWMGNNPVAIVIAIVGVAFAGYNLMFNKKQAAIRADTERRNNPPLIEVLSFEFEDASHDLEVVFKNVGRAIVLKDRMWLMEPRHEYPWVPFNCYSTDSDLRNVFYERKLGKRYLAFPHDVRHNEEFRVRFKHNFGAERGTGNQIHMRFTFLDKSGQEYTQDIKGHHWDRIYTTPVVKK